MFGGNGDDRMIGGEGADQFVVLPNGMTTIADFDGEEDAFALLASAPLTEEVVLLTFAEIVAVATETVLGGVAGTLVPTGEGACSSSA